ncbi:MAG: tetratricopeptide repeat protein [Zoogloeaceae bacterium]|jgi:predicted negative regulator of RcsB-dependent stress response|nr:tetratricopeptide repeat protein [Zoogloeaceae bacterium]
MAVYDLEEQEQLSELKAWWQAYGNLVTTLLLVVLVAVAGWLGWNKYQRNQAAEASVIYAVVQKGATAGDAKSVRDAAGELIQKYPGTIYAAMAALTSARMQFDAGDLKTARVQLQWVAGQAGDKGLRDLGRLRLAHVLFDQTDEQGARDEALKLLAEESLPAFAPRFEELKGDILLAQGKQAEAKTAYQAALTKQESIEKAAAGRGGRETQYLDLLRTKLDSLGDQ